MRPLFSVVLVPSMPMNEERLSTAGSLRITCVRACCRPAISRKETDCAASETPWMTPVSWMGKKPLGMRMNITMVTTRVASAASSVTVLKAQHYPQHARHKSR